MLICEITEVDGNNKERPLIKAELPVLPREGQVLVYETEDRAIDPYKYYKVLGVEIGLISKKVNIVVRRHLPLEEYRNKEFHSE